MIGKLKVFYQFSCPIESAASFFELEAIDNNNLFLLKKRTRTLPHT